jgi:hypothetical protein
MLIPRERQCRYEETGNANAKQFDTEQAGMRILRESDADAEREQCQGRRLPGNDAYNSTAISVTG